MTSAITGMISKVTTIWNYMTTNWLLSVPIAMLTLRLISKAYNTIKHIFK